ncbi:hypothetical protein ACRARG_09725 [Pseudooceanicola sp. C21-150M6]|uniref:phosphatase domain-containing protein n=1 Tax=Pseudooceanicola sp. C21-150M6 TaxID=3434355 RepID=UPI003D7F8F28
MSTHGDLARGHDATAPLCETSVRARIDCPGGGACLMSGFPGLQTGIDGSAYLDPESMTQTLSALRRQKATLMVVLTEEKELPEGAFPMLREQAESLGLELAFLPIPDYQAPDSALITSWQKLEKGRVDTPGKGGTIAFSCQYGAGRSGTMAAYLLIGLGMAPDQAIDQVRSCFSEAIESEVQVNWLTSGRH